LAGIVFSVLLSAAFWLFGSSVPVDPLEHGEWLATNSGTAAVALHLIPFAGVAFLWFIGVLRDRLGSMEDRFFATVFIGSALLFLSMIFVASTLVGDNTDSRCGAAKQIGGLNSIHACPRYGLRRDERVRGQNGRRLHDFDVHRDRLHQDCSALDRNYRIHLCSDPAAGKSIYKLGHNSIADLCPSDQHSDLDQQSEIDLITGNKLTSARAAIPRDHYGQWPPNFCRRIRFFIWS